MGKNFRETLNEQIKNPEFRKEWDALEPERQITRAMLEGRQNNHFTQEQLAEAVSFDLVCSVEKAIPKRSSRPAKPSRAAFSLLHKEKPEFLATCRK